MLRKWLPVCTLLLTACMGAPEHGPQLRRAESSAGQPVAGKLAAPPVRVALLLPLSGATETLGQSLLDASLLAIQDLYGYDAAGGAARLILIPKDTGGSANGAILAAEEAMRDQAQLIIGPVFSNALRAIAPAVQGRIPVIAFSNDRSVAGNGVYIMGLTPEQQVRRIVDFAVGRGMKRFAAFLPNDAYGSAVATAFEQAARAKGVTVDRVIYYPINNQDLTAEALRLLDMPPSPAADMPAATPAPGFDALLLPEGGARLRQVTDALTHAGIAPESVMLLGSGQWDDDMTYTIPAITGGYFTTAMPPGGRDFMQHFREFYGYEPERLASLAYDATALAVVLSQREPQGVTQQDMLSPAGFSGPADGIFRFSSDGSIERGLAVMRVTPDGPEVVDPAPSRF